MRAHHLLSLVVLVTASVVSTGCARTHLFYDTRELRHEPIEAKQRGALADLLANRLAGKQLVHVDAERNERVLTPDAGSLSKLGLAELGALWLATSTGDAGAENDLRVHMRGRGSTAVSVQIDLEGNVRVYSGEATARASGSAPSTDEIKKRFGLRGKMAGKWGAAERRALTEALAALSQYELQAVQDVAFARRGKAPGGDPSRAALYEAQGCKAVIYLFSTGVRADKYRFVGDATAPRNAMLHSITHEVGHAFEHAPARERYCRAKHKKGRMRNRLIQEGNAIYRQSLVLAEYLRVLGDDPAPTDYGGSSKHESFAEAFALWHMDPEALKRARPAVHAWFAAGGHLEQRPGS
jgi:hypothetical protein